MALPTPLRDMMRESRHRWMNDARFWLKRYRAWGSNFSRGSFEHCVREARRISRASWQEPIK